MTPAPTATWDGQPSVGQSLLADAPMQPQDHASRSQAQSRLQGMVHAHYTQVWRLLRWLGVQESELDDVTQDVFWIAVQRIQRVQLGSERAFLYGVAIRKAASARRKAIASVDAMDVDQLESAIPAPGPEQQLDDAQALAGLQALLQAMPDDLRVVFALFELEELEIPEIATLLEIPMGTVGSRLRRARDEFGRQARRLRARLAFQVRER